MWDSPSGEAFRTETPKPQPWCEWESGDQESLLGTQDTRIRGGFGESCPQRSGTLGYSQPDPRGQWELPGRELLPVSPWERACEPCGSWTNCRGREGKASLTRGWEQRASGKTSVKESVEKIKPC